jgi:hypothetical protein
MSSNPANLSIINEVIEKLSLAQADLLTAARATADNTKLIQINNEYMAVQSCMDQAAQAQAAADDALFKQATNALKTQAKKLEGMEDQIKKIISDVALAGRIVGYITQVIALVGQL